MSTIYLAHSISKSWETFQDWDWDKNPINFLVSFYYLEDYQRKAVKAEFLPHHMMLDSGAYTAWNAGKSVDIDALIKESKRKILLTEPAWDESVCLDVIGDANGSLSNSRYMRKNGSPAFPVFHIGEPWNILHVYCKEFSKVGISCRFGEPISASMAWVGECFKREWPHPFHSFGWVGKDVLTRFPFHSADSTGWMAPHRYGSWNKSLGGANVKDSWNYSLRGEVLEYLKLERFIQARWKKELKRWPKIIS